MDAKFLFLGTGGSAGVPLIGCSCSVCLSTSPLNKRLRSAGLLKVHGKNYLIDVGPDFREQALKYRIDSLDGVLITHPHSDHIAGIDDLRAYYFLSGKKMPCLLSQATFDEIKERFPYLLKVKPEGSIAAQLNFHILPHDFGHIVFEGLDVQYLSYFQSHVQVTGFRFGNFGYVSDIRSYSDRVFEELKGVSVLVLSALRHEPTQMHFSIAEAIAFAQKVGAATTYFTHIAHDIDHELVEKTLPKGFHLGYDGLEIDL